MDECQLEVSSSLVRWKSFDTEEEAKAFTSKQPCSEIMEKKGKFWRGYCKAGALAVESVREAGEYYKLAVPLSAGYAIGLNWADCH